jgi:hypothetical protein
MIFLGSDCHQRLGGAALGGNPRPEQFIVLIVRFISALPAEPPAITASQWCIAQRFYLGRSCVHCMALHGALGHLLRKSRTVL